MNKSADLYQMFFNSVSDAVFVFDAVTKTLIEANLQALRDTGYQTEEIEELPIDRLFQWQQRLATHVFLPDTDEAHIRSDDALLLEKSGGRIAVSVSVTSVECSGEEHLIFTARKLKTTLYHGDSGANGEDRWPENQDFPSIIGQSEKIRDVCGLIGSVAKTQATVLIQGESGTGKEIVANAIHAHSLRCGGPFVKVNCALLRANGIKKRAAVMLGIDPRNMPYLLRKHRLHNGFGRIEHAS